jgi:tRNA(adenine34) deaminase
MNDKFFYMNEALTLAKAAAAEGEIPVGAVIVKDGKIIARGKNRRENGGGATAHAEIEAINAACAALGTWRLNGCTMYVTLEPCPMCAGAIVQARIPKVVIGSMNPKAGCAGSVLNVLQTDGLNHQVDIESGVLGDECSCMLSDFFRELRKIKKARKMAEKALQAENENA